MVDIVTLTVPLNKSNIFKRVGINVYLLDLVCDAYYPKVGLELLKEVIDFSCILCPIVG